MDLGIEEVLEWEGELEGVEVPSLFPSLQVWALRMSFLYPRTADETKICFPGSCGSSHRRGAVQRTDPIPPSTFVAGAANPQIKPEIPWSLFQGSGPGDDLLRMA